MLEWYLIVGKVNFRAKTGTRDLKKKKKGIMIKGSIQAEGMVQVIECLPTKHEAQRSNPNIAKRKKKKGSYKDRM
jgi:hypothetical protein